jgi:hypothetical protein
MELVAGSRLTKKELPVEVAISDQQVSETPSPVY